VALFTGISVWLKFDGVNWTDVSSWLRDVVTIEQGRATEFDEVGPGKMEFTLANPDGRFMPDNTASPYSPNVREDIEVWMVIRRGASSWTRFRGWVKAWEPEFPGELAMMSRVKVSCVDTLGLCATRKVESWWVQGASYWAGTVGTRWDSIVMRGNGEAATYLLNPTSSPAPIARARVFTAVGGVGALSFGDAEGLSVEGAATFNPTSNFKGSTIRVDTAGGQRCLQFWLRVPQNDQVSTGFKDVLAFRNSGGTLLMLLSLTNNAGETDLNFYTGGSTFAGTLAFGARTTRWLRISLLTHTGAPTTTDAYCDGGGLNGGGFLTIPLDLRACTSFTWGGGLGRVPQMSVAGISLAGLETAAIPAANGLVGAPAGTLANRLNGWAWTVPGGLAASVGSATSDATLTGTAHGRTSLEVGQQIARTGGGLLWCRPGDRQPRYYASDVCYPTTPLVTLDAEGDLKGAPSLRRGVDSRPTRVQVDYPAGSGLAIDAAAEAGAFGQVRSTSVSTLATSYTQAEAIGAALLARSAGGLRITQVTLDLEGSVTDHVPALFDESSPSAGLFPTQTIGIALPASHFTPATRGMSVQGWTETYPLEQDEPCTITFDLSPATNVVWPPDVGGVGGGGGGGAGGGGGSAPTLATVGSSSYAVSAVNPTDATNPAGAGYPGARGVDQLVIYQSPLTVTATNQWGVEVTLDGAGVVTAVNDREVSGSTTGTTVPAAPGKVLSGHGAAASWLRTNATVGVTVVLSGGGTAGGGGTGTVRPTLSGLPWYNGVFDNTNASTAKVDAFAAMSTRPIDVVDAHPDWVDLPGGTGKDWWYAAHVGRGYNMQVSAPLVDTSISVSGASAWGACAASMVAAGFTKAYYRPGLEMNLSGKPDSCTDANFATWKTRFIEVANAIRTASPSARIILCLNEGLGSGALSTANQAALATDLAAYYDVLAVDYYDQWEAILNSTQAAARFGDSTTFGTMNYWLARAQALGKSFALPEWGVSSGSQWAGHTGGDNAFYINYVLDWCATNSATVEFVCYFEEPAAYLKSDITTTATNPNSRTAYRTKIAQYATGTGTGGGGTGGGTGTAYPSKVVAAYKKIWSSDSPVTGVPAGATEIRLSFGQNTPPSLVGFTSAGQASFMASLASRRAAGQRVILSLGGAGGAIDISQRSSILSGIAAIKAQLEAGGAGLDGIDWDLEGSATLGSADCVAISSSLKSSYGSTFAILMAPNGSNQSQYRTAAAAMHAAGCLDWIGQQYYDASVSLAAAKNNIDLYIAAGIPAAKIGVGMSVAPNYSGGGYWDLATCQANMTDIRNTYGITKCYLWSEDANLSQAAGWVSAMRTIVGI